MTTSLQNINDNWIYQSNKLIEASHSFTVLEQKLIRLLASMIKKDDIELKEYQFKAVELSKILSIHEKSIYRELDKVTDKLMLRVIKVKNNEAEKFKKYHLIKNANFENGILSMKIDEEMKDFYIELKQYTKYQLKNILQFKSTYSFRLYELLKQYEKIGNREIGIDNLRTVLDINEDQYPKYSNLKQKVIKVAIDEININTDLYIEYEELKESRKVISIKFYIKQNKARNEIAAAVVEVEEDPQDLCFIKQVQAICNKHIITEHEARCILKDANNNIDLIGQCYAYSLSKSKIDNITGYIRTLVKGFNKPQGIIKTGDFNDYEQREYDFKDLERKLLGWE